MEHQIRVETHKCLNTLNHCQCAPLFRSALKAKFSISEFISTVATFGILSLFEGMKYKKKKKSWFRV